MGENNHLTKSFWHFLYQRRRRHHGRDEYQILAGVILSLGGALIAGVILDSLKLTLSDTVGIFVLLPAVFELGGSAAGAYAAKLSHHYGISKSFRGAFGKKILYALGVVGLASIIVGIFAGIITEYLFNGSFIKILQISVLSSILAAIIGLPIVGLATIFATRRGYDADNLIGPIETSLFDVLTIICAALAIMVLA